MCLRVGGSGEVDEFAAIRGEMVVFEPGSGPVECVATEDSELVIGSARRHHHDLVLGYYSVHTSEAALDTGEARIREIHDNRNLLDTEDKLRAFFGTFGVDAATFQSTYESAGVQTKVQRADELGRRYRVASVPTIVVNGKYVTDAGMAGGTEQLFALIGELAGSEHSGK